ncbi:MAG: hypothetical protein LHW58_05810 [Candidatus Cloacimonetes bacterium]|nr:hypothetical protein [Candidatus Cloacimonadota bacterium]MCK9179100.1 hypothetical protein [Candidatus Cloacimonadota bacterium]
MKNTKSILIALILMISLSSVFAEDNSAAVYTRLGIDARSIGMGGTGAAFLDNVSSTYLNPAALADVKRIELITSTRQGMEWDKGHNAVALGFMLPVGYVAAYWQGATVSDIDGYDDQGQPTSSFDATDHSFGLSFAAKIGKLNLGVTPKMYLSTIDDESTTGFGLDLGALYHLNRFFSMGVVARDLVSDYDGEGTDVPREFVTGIAAFPLPGLILSADLAGNDDFDETKLKIGAEYWLGVRDDGQIGSSISGIRIKESATWTDILSDTQAGIRAGINDGAFSAGFGLRFKMLELNYAYQMAKEDYQNDNHLYSLLLRF